MPKILFVDHAPILGGAEVALMALMRGLDPDRFSAVVATAPGSALLPILASEKIPALIVPLQRINLRSPTFLLRLVHSSLALVRAVHRLKPDLMHSNTARAHAICSIASLITGVPLVWTVHDRTLPFPVFRLLGRAPRRIIFVSKFLRDLYGPYIRNNFKAKVIHNGLRPVVPVDKGLARRELGLHVSAPVILNVGRLIESKGQHVFLQAAQMISLRRSDAIYVLVGGVNPADRASIRFGQRLLELAHRPELSSKVVFAGQQPDVANYYAAADVCTYTAVAPEGFGLVILEAMANGKAVVASRLGPVAELVCDGVTGGLVRPGDPEQLALAIQGLLDDRDTLTRMGLAGKKRVIEHFDPTDGFLRTQALYDEVLAPAVLV